MDGAAAVVVLWGWGRALSKNICSQAKWHSSCGYKFLQVDLLSVYNLDMEVWWKNVFFFWYKSNILSA